jgi:hypothetical protein
MAAYPALSGGSTMSVISMIPAMKAKDIQFTMDRILQAQKFLEDVALDRPKRSFMFNHVTQRQNHLLPKLEAFVNIVHRDGWANLNSPISGILA